jgi:hypothetical protein
MFIANKKIRMFLIENGFSAPSNDDGLTGVIYMLIPSENKDLVLMCNLKSNHITAEMPDFEYNKKNRMSPKNKIINYTWSSNDDTDNIIHNIETFITKVYQIYEKGV